MSSRQKLELTWVGKDERPRLEPRILLEDSALSYHAKARVSEADQFDNRLIFGDNLLALKALEEEFAGKVKCVFIDPPYNTGSAFQHYDDAVEHSLWLSLMRDRLEILHRLLRDDGSIWITIDDNESHYLKVLCDEIWGRRNFVANIVWQRTHTRENRTDISTVHDDVLVYAKDRTVWKGTRNLLPASDEQLARYSNPDNDPRGPWASLPAHAKAEIGRRAAQFFTVRTPSGREVNPPPGRCWLYTEPRFQEMVADRRIWFGESGENVPRVKKFLAEVGSGLVPASIWPHEEVGTTGSAKAEIVALFPNTTPFSTPKPERLISRILGVATNPGDLVLDSFAGSGTTGAVAHKLGRRWIMVELGEHCHTHIIPRIKKVIDADDPGGITEATNWSGGGGFRYFRLAPSLLERDRWGNWVISKQYNAAMLAEAVCKIEGFRYAPSAEVFWQHGQSSEQDFIWVTTQELTAQQLDAIATDVGPNRSLLVCCAAWTGDATAFPNLTLKKLPNTVLARCEFGKDDYSLAIAAMPTLEIAAADADEEPEEPAEAAPRRRPAAKRGRRSKG
jgi:adenine-specific DNA-methyltransferase